MLLSSSCRYALRASIYLAQQPEGKFVATKEMCASLGISFHYLIKIMQKLNKHNLIQSERGTKGGIRLARAANSIFIKDIIETIEGESFFTKCVLGFPNCGAPDECALHKEWVAVKGNLIVFFSETSLAYFSDNDRMNDMNQEFVSALLNK
ncbi:MAG: Rrf2 family transcriptional regulator [Balneolales bacterium]